MQPTTPLGRRKFVKLAAAVTSSTVIAGTTTACQGRNDRQLKFASLEQALEELNKLASAKNLTSEATWNWSQTLNHCAQSIEFSIVGFPEAKSALFQRTIGAAAFEVFSWRGRMTHNLAEPIPGAPELEANADATAAADRLRAAIEAFNFWPGPLQPHFAYGDLSKQEYDQAHAMHLANHFSQFRVAE